MIKRLLCLLTLTVSTLTSDLPAQNISDSVFSAGLFMASYALDFPQGDLASRFGTNSEISGSMLYKTRGNFLWGGSGGFLFGENVKEDNLFRNISTPDGYLIDRAGTFAEIYLYERGYYLMGTIGKIISLGKPNPNSGLLITLGAGYLSHKIRIENPNKSAPQVQGDYKKGYDRLTGGFMTSQYLGYVFFSNKKIYNFHAGIECKEAWTESRRAFQFDTGAKDNRKRFDMLWGVKVGWILPFYQKTSQVFYYY